MMKFACVLTAFTIVAAAFSPAAAQSRATTERDVLSVTPLVAPAPENRDIVLGFGASSQIYFKQPIKSVRIGDPYAVKAVPHSDHIIEFTGLAPGTSNITIEATDGTTSSWGIVTVVREPREVKIYSPSPSSKSGDNGTRANVVINTGNNGAEAKQSAEADYRSVLCNEVGCQPLPQPPSR